MRDINDIWTAVEIRVYVEGTDDPVKSTRVYLDEEVEAWKTSIRDKINALDADHPDIPKMMDALTDTDMQQDQFKTSMLVSASELALAPVAVHGPDGTLAVYPAPSRVVLDPTISPKSSLIMPHHLA